MDDVSRGTVLVENGTHEPGDAPTLVPGADGVLVPEAPAAVPSKRRPGRPRGLGRVPGSGRKRGTRNRDTLATAERIRREYDPIAFLGKVMRGDRMTGAPEPGGRKKGWWFPTGEQRISAAKILAAKVLPDLKSVEASGPRGEPVTVIIDLGRE